MNLESTKCPCCGRNEMDQVFIKKLMMAEKYCPFPFVITSGFRCEKHNATLPDSSPTSSHLKRLAVDIAVANSWERLHVVHALLQGGFERLGIGKNFVHVDDDMAKPRPVMWLY